MKYVLALVALAPCVVTLQAQQPFSDKTVPPLFQGNSGASWWNGWSQLKPVRQAELQSLLLKGSEKKVCSIPLREVPVAKDLDPAVVRPAPENFDRMPQVKLLAPPCEEVTPR